jgi:hypothetical protein
MATIDMTTAYRIDGRPGIAFRVVGWEQVWEPYMALVEDVDTGEEYEVDSGDGEWVNGPRPLVVAIGDDRKEPVDLEDLTPLNRADYCGECGQVGCAHDGYDREEG